MACAAAALTGSGSGRRQDLVDEFLDRAEVAVQAEDLPANGVFTKTITLEEGKLYSLVVYDDGEDGIENGQG